ncbi:MAG TPA: hypothetical protein VK569_11150 [Bacteroidota bacterium]|nr:hypothetical protein [Bacteroidota bacterium]
MALKPEVREAIFHLLRRSLREQCPPMVCTKDSATCYEVIGNSPMPYGSTRKIVPGMYFASAVVHRNMVSFHFMPVYYRLKDYAAVAPTLIRSLKGKACFNFRKLDQIDEAELDAMLKKGALAWKKLGYMK